MGPAWVQSEDKIPGGFKSTPKIIFSLPSSSLVTQLSEKVWHANGGDICDDDNYLGQLVTEARVQGGETALWSKWDTSTTTLKYHHLRHLWRFQWKHYSDTLQNCGVNTASGWILLNLSIFWLFFANLQSAAVLWKPNWLFYMATP